MPPVVPKSAAAAASCHTRPRRSSSCFLGCFGFHMRVSSDEKSPAKPRSVRRRSSGRRLPFSGLWVKRPGSKTVPVDQKTEIPAAETKTPDRTVAAAETPRQEGAAVGNRETSVQPGSGGDDDKCRRTPEPNPKLRRSTVPFPARTAPKKDPANQPRPRGAGEDGAAETLGPLAGMSIIVVTLLLMLLWGRLCAIACTCAWCCFIPRRLREAAAAANTSSGAPRGDSDPDPELPELDLSSEEYKKKVVMEGFLRRSRRSTAGGAR